MLVCFVWDHSHQIRGQSFWSKLFNDMVLRVLVESVGLIYSPAGEEQIPQKIHLPFIFSSVPSWCPSCRVVNFKIQDWVNVFVSPTLSETQQTPTSICLKEMWLEGWSNSNGHWGSLLGLDDSWTEIREIFEKFELFFSKETWKA